MKKLLIAILVLGVAGLAYYFIGGNKDNIPFDEGFIEEDDSELAQEALRETGTRTVYGSCNAIPATSNCVDYVGSMWNDNNSAQLHCANAGVFSKNTCPYSQFGGCQTNGGSVMETIAWVYPEGGGGYDTESVMYARMSCDSLPNAQWVTPEELL